jgi:hypothetical protein
MKDIKYKGYVISKTHNGTYRITKDDGSDKHTHLQNLNPCYKLIDNVVAKKTPKRCGFYFITSHIRLSDDETYINRLKDYIEVKKQKGKKQNYFNPHRKNFG